MATRVVMPTLGLTMTEGTVDEWKINQGDSVKAGDILFSVSTDKLTNDIEAEADGVLLKILLPEGESAPCKATIAWIGEEGEEIPEEESGEDVKIIENTPTQSTPMVKNKDENKSVIVIGGGPGGYVAAIRAAQLGANVTIIEPEFKGGRYGGTCVNVGCIPTKAILHSAQLFSEMKERGSELGIEATDINVNFKQVIAHKNAITNQLSGGVAGLLKKNGVRKIDGFARILSNKKVEVENSEGKRDILTADAIIIAVGSVNAVPPIPGVKEYCIDSTDVLELEDIPKSMAVIGGGVIGCEIACAYATFGTKVTVIEALDHILPVLDEDITAIGMSHMEKIGVEFHLSSPVQAVEKHEDMLRVVCKNNEDEDIGFEAEKVLLAVGRKPNTANLGLEESGINCERGYIVVNDKMETNMKDIYAVGDCVMGKAQLAHTAMTMGEVAAENIMGGDSIYDQKTNASCVYMEPESASVGITEKQAKEMGLDYIVGKFPMIGNGKALIENGGEGIVKIIAGKKYGEILGMHISGPRASDLISEGALAIRLEATLDELISTIHSHPTVSEATRECALNALGRSLHI